MKRFLSKITILSIMTLLLINISSTSFAAKVKVSKIKLNKTEISLIADKTATIKPTVSVTPNTASNKKVTFKSSNEKVAKVDSKGKVTAIKAGTATITVTSKKDSKVYAKCKVTVKPSYQGVELKYSEKYNVCKTPLTKRMGVKYYGGHKETYYSQRVLPGEGLTALNNNGRHVANDGTIRDKDGYIAVACNYLKQGSKIMTSLGPGKVYDTGDMTGKWIDIYVNW